MSKALRAVVATSICATLVLVQAVSPALSCPFCSAPSLTLAEQLAQADAAVLVKWVGGEKATDKSAGETRYEVTEVVRSSKVAPKVGDTVTLPRYRESKVGDQFLLLGNKGASVEWGSPLEVSRTTFDYIAKAPNPDVPTTKRLEYYVKFLEHSDQMIANDAYGEFANAPYEDITKLDDKLPREKISGWITNKDTPATRLGLYGLLIGLCGNDQDAKNVEEKILEETDDFRLGIDGLMSGYLLLKKGEGLTVLDKAKLSNRDVPFSETYAAMQALRFMWKYSEGTIEKPRLRQSMRILLDRPELADLVIADLARWKDWSLQDRLMATYVAAIASAKDDEADDERKAAIEEIAKSVLKGNEGVESQGDAYNVPSIKRAIVRYMLVSSKDVPEEATTGEDAELPEHAVKGRRYVEMLRKLDPKTVSQAERFFFLK